MAKASPPVVLLIGPNDSARMALFRILEFEGFSVLPAASASEASLFVGQLTEPPLLIIADLPPPAAKMGQDICDEKRLKGIPLVAIVSDEPGPSTVQVAEVIVRKPAELDAVLRIVRLYCGTPHVGGLRDGK